MEDREYLSYERLLPYKVGALLYSPANRDSIAIQVVEEKIHKPYSLALCLEDAISDNAVESAELCLKSTLEIIDKAQKERDFYTPLIFVRVREPEQISRLAYILGDLVDIVTGFIAPKFTVDNAEAYISEIKNLNKSDKKIYLMPVLESIDLFSLESRADILAEIKSYIDSIKEYVLNIRVGGNDFCNHYGLRRYINNTIYDIGVVNSILSDIITVFASDYVVSAAVWEYFNQEGWEEGLSREIKLDKLNGFIGKTAIHPNQIPVINKSLSVWEEDYKDALSILDMVYNDKVFVEKGCNGGRMNEYKTHKKWAEKIISLAEVYGVRSGR